MRSRIRKHLTFANVAALVALVFAMAGTSYAVTLSRNSVASKHIKRFGVANSDIRPNAVTTTKVKDRSLREVDFALGQLPSGPRGLQGAQGVPGPRGVVGAVTVQREDVALPDNSTAGAQVTCPNGTKIIAGGGSVDQTGSDDIHQTASRPFRTTPGLEGDLPVDNEPFDAWRVVFRNPSGGTGAATVYAFAICAET